MTTESVVSKLNDYSSIMKIIQSKHFEIDRVKTMKYSLAVPKTQKYNKLKDKNNISDQTFDITEEICREYDHIISALLKEIIELQNLKREIDFNVGKLPLEYQKLIMLRYFQKKKWFQIEMALNYSQRQPYYINKKAIEQLASGWESIDVESLDCII